MGSAKLTSTALTSLHLQHQQIHSSLNFEETSEKQQITHYRTLKKTFKGGKT